MSVYPRYAVSPVATAVYEQIIKTILNCWKQDPGSFDWSPSVDSSRRIVNTDDKMKERIRRNYGISLDALDKVGRSNELAYIEYFLDKYVKARLPRGYSGLDENAKAATLQYVVGPIADEVNKQAREENAQHAARLAAIGASRRPVSPSTIVPTMASSRAVSPPRQSIMLTRPVSPTPRASRQDLNAEIEKLEYILANLKRIRDSM